jgi:UDP-N-acetylglucosamine 2-epimerase (non-hydrolysing)
VTIRDVTERPETIECGSNILSGANPETILQCVRIVLDQETKWNVPPEYVVDHVSDTVIKIVLGYDCRKSVATESHTTSGDELPTT